MWDGSVSKNKYTLKICECNYLYYSPQAIYKVVGKI